MSWVCFCGNAFPGFLSLGPWGMGWERVGYGLEASESESLHISVGWVVEACHEAGHVGFAGFGWRDFGGWSDGAEGWGRR